jgi:nucleotide-binding universal stress UspA family protein
MIPSERFIVVGIDGSEPSKCALRWAAMQAELTGVALRAVGAWHIPATSYGPVMYPGGFDPKGDAATIVTQAIGEAQLSHPTVDIGAVVAEGLAGAVLIEAAQGADLLVVGSRGHGAITGMLLGSISEHCVTHGSCPVVVIHGSLIPA